MVLKLYKMDLSPVARAAMMTCDYLNIPVEMIEINLKTGEHLTPDYVKKNPVHTVPVFEDGDFVIHDSHAILEYLADTYGKSDDCYPKDTKKRAKVNQILYFNSGYLFTRLAAITLPGWMEGVSNISKTQLDRIEEAYGFVEEFLSRSKYIALDQFTIADVSTVATVTSLGIILPLDGKKFPKTQEWIENIAKNDFYRKYNIPGHEILANALKPLLKFP